MPGLRRVKRLSSTLVALFLLAFVAACGDRSTTVTAPHQTQPTHLVLPGLRVSPSGTDMGACVDSPCATIGYAVSKAHPGDRISVAAGTYDESVQITKRLTLVGHDATIDASGNDRGVVISGPAAAGTVLAGFTIENADLEGVFAVQTSHVTIRDNEVAHDDALGATGQCPNPLDDCGEAIHLMTVTGSTVRGNDVHDNVGGILLTDEHGPTYGDVIRGNTVVDNVKDCGITLASHHFDPSGAATPDVAGVYENRVLRNTSNGNGAAGIGVFAGPPGAAAWDNLVSDNTARNNGAGGLMLHSHTPAQDVDGNRFTDNTLSGNGPDPDNPVSDAPTGFSIFSAVVPIPHTVVSGNRISQEHYGLAVSNAEKLSGLSSNKFDGTVAVPIARN